MLLVQGASNNSEQVMLNALAHSANINVPDSSDEMRTALHKAVNLVSIRICVLLLYFFLIPVIKQLKWK